MYTRQWESCGDKQAFRFLNAEIWKSTSFSQHYMGHKPKTFILFNFHAYKLIFSRELSLHNCGQLKFVQRKFVVLIFGLFVRTWTYLNYQFLDNQVMEIHLNILQVPEKNVGVDFLYSIDRRPIPWLSVFSNSSGCHCPWIFNQFNEQRIDCNNGLLIRRELNRKMKWMVSIVMVLDKKKIPLLSKRYANLRSKCTVH